MSERCWHAVSSRSLPWCLWSAACRRTGLIRPCYCNSNRLCLHVCTKWQQIGILPLYCHSQHLSVSFSASLSVWLFVLCSCQRVCLSVSVSLASFTAPPPPKQDEKFPSFIYFRQMADSLMLSGSLCVVYCLAPGCLARTQSSWTADLKGRFVKELYSTNTKAKLAVSQHSFRICMARRGTGPPLESDWPPLVLPLSESDSDRQLAC